MKSGMEHVNTSYLGHSLHGMLRNAILVMCTNSTESQVLPKIMAMWPKLGRTEHTIVQMVGFDGNIHISCLPLKM